MKTVTIDHIVRNSLMDLGLPLHYYVRFLHYALRCLEEINYDFPLGETSSGLANVSSANAKRTELDVTDYMRAVIPSDAVDIISVEAKYGEHVLPLRLDQSLNIIQKYDSSGDKIAYTDQSNLVYNEDLVYTATSTFGHVNEYGEHMGRAFGIAGEQAQSYAIDRGSSELVFNNALEVNKVVVSYITDGVSTSEANIVHPYAQDVIEKYIKYQKYANGRQEYSKVGLARDEYKIAKRRLRSRLNSLSYSDIISALRRGIHGSIKN